MGTGGNDFKEDAASPPSSTNNHAPARSKKKSFLFPREMFGKIRSIAVDRPIPEVVRRATYLFLQLLLTSYITARFKSTNRDFNILIYVVVLTFIFLADEFLKFNECFCVLLGLTLFLENELNTILKIILIVFAVVFVIFDY